MKKWRSQGKLVSMFLDDGFGCWNDFLNTSIMSREIKEDLLKSGLLPKADKSVWIPVQYLSYLGANLNSETGCISTPDTRINRVRQTIADILFIIKVHRRVTVRQIASLVGQLISIRNSHWGYCFDYD